MKRFNKQRRTRWREKGAEGRLERRRARQTEKEGAARSSFSKSFSTLKGIVSLSRAVLEATRNDCSLV